MADPFGVHAVCRAQEARARRRAVIVTSGGLENKQTGRIYKTALEVGVANDRIARRYSGLAERLASVSAGPLTAAGRAARG